MAEKEVTGSSEEEGTSSRGKRSAPKRGYIHVTVTPPPTSGRPSRSRPMAGYELPAGAQEGNTKYGRRMVLWGRRGFHLAILPKGRVKGVEDENAKTAMLETSSAGAAGEIRIKGLESQLYLAMNKDGKLYGEPDKNNEATVFIESILETHYNTYLSKQWAHLGWYVGIKKDGKIKPGNRTKWGQKATQFLPRLRS